MCFYQYSFYMILFAYDKIKTQKNNARLLGKIKFSNCVHVTETATYNITWEQQCLNIIYFAICVKDVGGGEAHYVFNEVWDRGVTWRSERGIRGEAMDRRGTRGLQNYNCDVEGRGGEGGWPRSGVRSAHSMVKKRGKLHRIKYFRKEVPKAICMSWIDESRHDTKHF